MPQQFGPAQFIAKWSRAELSERAASQSHFNDLCELSGQSTPTDHDATGAEYTFEKCVVPLAGASRGAVGERGFVDVWWRGKFAWEYKRKGKYRDLTEAYRQLCQYREALENPPLLIVSDIARTEIHTNFTGTVKQVHAIALADMAEPRSLGLLRRVFTDPESFKPDVTAARVTEDVAKQFASLAQSLRSREHEAHAAAHFLMKCMFCLFAEDVSLLPGALFTKLVERHRKEPAKLTDRLTDLFATMRTGGEFGVETVAHFNGGLFDEAPALRLTAADIDTLLDAADKDWGSVEPAIFGTLFERSLDPNTRAQIGAHYTSRDDIMLVVEPVVMAPLRREWEAVKADVEAQLDRRRKGKADTKKKADKAIEKTLRDFVHRLASVRILDPACGSGNFLYVAIQQLLHLEKAVITYAARPDIALGLFPLVRPTQLYGIEINPYAAELAQVVIWIGYLQWMRDNGFAAPRDPILELLQTIECRDAILDLSDPEHPRPATWPEADFIIGNPPFAGRGQKRGFLRHAFGQDYPDSLVLAYSDSLKSGVDLCCYWFELGRRRTRCIPSTRVGLLATQGVRGGTNREVLESIARDGQIFFAISDRDWILEGATVHVSMVGFHGSKEAACSLDGQLVATINPDLTSGANVAQAVPIPSLKGLASQGVIRVGGFVLPFQIARTMLRQPNPNGRPNADVLRAYANGDSVSGRDSGSLLVYFGAGTTEADASQYQAPFEYVRRHIEPVRRASRYAHVDRYPFWLCWNPRDAFLTRTDQSTRYLATTRVSKYRLFRWVQGGVIPDDSVVAIAVDSDYCFGVLQSAIHMIWAAQQGTQLREEESGKRYTPRSCLETFAFPWPFGSENTQDDAFRRIEAAAIDLNTKRERWLNPPEWIDSIAAAIDAKDDFSDVPEEARALMRRAAIMAGAASDCRFKDQTLTKLYNEWPAWLGNAHEELDRAVLTAYAMNDADGEWREAWAPNLSSWACGLARSADSMDADVEQRILTSLIRLNRTVGDRLELHHAG